jgi:lipopolysaccharide/colanic/teichoic acid biosynthesis glycosyltransferase
MTGKRFFDLIFSVIGLLILMPIFIVISVWIRLDSPGPIFFRQVRIGRFGKPFRIYKFRTMVADAELKGQLITSSEDPRITRAGKFLRCYKLDELPQLLNVFIGDMSIVGPRPEVPRYVEMFRDQYKDVLTVKPGITDYAAIEFRDEESLLKQYTNPEDGYIKEVLPKKIDLYKKYLMERSIKTDIKVILLTLKKIM